MKPARAITCFIAVFTVVPFARGQSATCPFDESTNTSPFTLRVAGEAGEAAQELDLLGGVATEVDTSAAPAPHVLELPAAPNSAALVLSAMLTLGAWQVLRSASHLHLAPLPDWYHPGGPKQIGHVTPLDLNFGNITLCLFDGPITEPQNARVDVRPDDDARLAYEQFRLSSRTPRAPPSSH